MVQLDFGVVDLRVLKFILQAVHEAREAAMALLTGLRPGHCDWGSNVGSIPKTTVKTNTATTERWRGINRGQLVLSGPSPGGKDSRVNGRVSTKRYGGLRTELENNRRRGAGGCHEVLGTVIKGYAREPASA